MRVYLVRASVPGQEKPIETADPPAPARALGRLGDVGRLTFAPRAAGRFRLVALISVQPNGAGGADDADGGLTRLRRPPARLEKSS